MVTRVVLADQGEARFYEVERLGEPLRLIGRLRDPKAHLHDRDLKSDRPGRLFDRAPAAGQRRGSVGQHSTGGERTPRTHEAELFAKRVARELATAQRSARFDRLVVVAGLPFLGYLRGALPKSGRAAVVAEVPKDLLHESERAVREHLADLSVLA